MEENVGGLSSICLLLIFTQNKKEKGHQATKVSGSDKTMAAAKESYNDDSTDCAICFESLSGDDTITLKCGHRWHLACIREQLAHAQPSKSSRILFSGCRCAKCNVICDRKFLFDTGSFVQ